MASPLNSPRSSTSSADISNLDSPVTPSVDTLGGLEKVTEGMVLGDEAEEENIISLTPSGTAVGAQEPKAQFAAFSFGRPPTLAAPIPYPDTLSSPTKSPHSPPSSTFKFGSCPSVPLLSTPTAELGPFEYPVDVLPGNSTRRDDSMSSTSSAFSRSSIGSSSSRASSSVHRGAIPPGLALGESHRRNSIIGRPSLSSTSTSTSTSSVATITGLTPPQIGRSSTTSIINTIPSGGRRPSIIHSATTESGSVLPLAVLPPPSSPLPNPNPNPNPYNGAIRRSSILFPQKLLHQPVPPSLLARRGSMPISSFADLSGKAIGSSSSPLRGSKTRSSMSGTSVQEGYGRPGEITSHRLYHRRESVMSTGSSQGSGSTLRASGKDEISRRSSLRENRRVEGEIHGGGRRESGSSVNSSDVREGQGVSRRSSMPAHHALSSSKRIQSMEDNPSPSKSYDTSVGRTRHSSSHPPLSSNDDDNNQSPNRIRASRKSMSGTSLFSSSESDEMEPALDQKGGPGNGVVFADPWSGESGARTESGTQGSQYPEERSMERTRGETLAEMGRPTLETVDSDRTERGDDGS